MAGDSNIEVKKYSDKLTNSHKNLWNTLSNWLKDEFDSSKFTQLILLTTQPISKRSTLHNWNKNTPQKKHEILKKTLNQAEKKFTVSKKNKPSKVLILMRSVLDTEQQKLNNILAKFIITDSSPMPKEKYKNLLDERAKTVLEKNRERYINAQMGFILSPKVIHSNSWTINYDDFTAEIQELTSHLGINNRTFPSKPIDPKQLTVISEEKLYLQKIKDIKYYEVIAQAHNEYTNTLHLIDEEFRQGTPQKYLSDYEEGVVSNFNSRYRKACRHTAKNCPKDFFDGCITETPPDFPSYTDSQKWFRNGVLHINMDDENLDFKWALEKT